METVRGALFLLSSGGYLLWVYKKLNMAGWFAPILTVSGVSLALYAGGLLGLLEPVSYGVLAQGLVCLAYVCKKAAEGGIRFEIPGLAPVCMGLGSLFFLALMRMQNFQHYDNFSHWALIVKYLLGAGRFPGAEETLISFKDYPPGTAVFLYYVCSFLGREEGVMLAAQTAVILSCFAAAFGIVRESRRFLLYAFPAMGFSMLSYLNLTIRINNLLVDFLLPLMALASLSATSRYREEPLKASLCAALMLGFTGIIKNTGLIFSGIPFLYYARTILRKKEIRLPGRLWICGLTGIALLLPFLFWQQHVSVVLAGTEIKFSLTSELTEYQAADPALYGQIIRLFIRAASDLSGRAAQVFVLAHLAAGAGLWYTKVRMKKRWKLGRTLLAADVVTLLYYVGILGMYLYAMPEDEAVRLAGFERYACSIMTLFAGILILQVTRDMERSFAVDIDERGSARAYSSPEAKRRYQYGVLVTLVLALNFLYSEFNGLVSIQAEYATSLPGRVRKLTGDRWYRDGVPDPDSYLVAAADRNGQVSDWSLWYVCRYFLYTPHVEVTQSLDSGRIGAALENYDYIVVLDPEAVRLEPADPGYEQLQQPGVYSTRRLGGQL